MKKELELYLHIPFCVKKCGYCDFLSGAAGPEKQKEYVEALCREIDTGYGNDRIVSTIFIGGGTPSILPGAWIGQIMEHVREHYKLDDHGEISMEANPGTVDREKLEAYKAAGINRLSFGCQSADNRELKELGRIHTWETFLESYHLAREAGFGNVNVDLMSGLPGQTAVSWEKSLRKVLELKPEHISAYSLIIEEGTPFASGKLDLPDEDEERLMYERTHEIMEEYGFHQYEISNYASPGRECRHNVGYWQRKEYLGLGLGSASLMDETRFSNTRDFREYVENSGQPEKIRRDVEKLDISSQMEEFMFLGLRMTQGIREEDFWKKFGVSIDSIYEKVIRKYCDTGFLKREDGRIWFTRKGISVSNPILAEFLL